MFVDRAELHSGADHSARAGEHAQTGADHLAGAPVTAGMFGDFDVAHAFHATLTEAHERHVETLGLHQQILSRIGDNAHQAATDFTAMEARNAEAMHAVEREAGCT